MSHLQRAIEESIATLRSLSVLEEPLQRAVQVVSRCLTSGKKLLVCGNGGSASDATHLATEFLCRRFGTIARQNIPSHFAHRQRRVS